MPTGDDQQLDDQPVIVAGGGIGGLVAALSLQAIGRPVHVYESADEIRALGVDINLLPHAGRRTPSCFRWSTAIHSTAGPMVG